MDYSADEWKLRGRRKIRQEEGEFFVFLFGKEDAWPYFTSGGVKRIIWRGGRERYPIVYQSVEQPVAFKLSETRAKLMGRLRAIWPRRAARFHANSITVFTPRKTNVANARVIFLFFFFYLIELSLRKEIVQLDFSIRSLFSRLAKESLPT